MVCNRVSRPRWSKCGFRVRVYGDGRNTSMLAGIHRAAFVPGVTKRAWQQQQGVTGNVQRLAVAPGPDLEKQPWQATKETSNRTTLLPSCFSRDAMWQQTDPVLRHYDTRHQRRALAGYRLWCPTPMAVTSLRSRVRPFVEHCGAGAHTRSRNASSQLHLLKVVQQDSGRGQRAQEGIRHPPTKPSFRRAGHNVGGRDSLGSDF